MFDDYTGSGAGFRKMAWSEWGATNARGTGVFYAKDCMPSCADSISTEYPITITLSGVTTCSKDVRVFTSATLRAVNITDQSLIEQRSSLTFKCPPAPVSVKPRPAGPIRFTNALAAKWVSRLADKRGSTNGAYARCRGATARGNRATCTAQYYVGDGLYKMTVTISLTRNGNKQITSVSGRAQGRMRDDYACYVTKTSCAWRGVRWIDRVKP